MQFVAYTRSNSRQQAVGLVSKTGDSVIPLRGSNGRPLNSINELIQDWTSVSSQWQNLSGEGNSAVKLSDVTIKAPLRGRDVLCVGKNYKEHASEFHNSGYDSSDNKAMPDFPVIFTKRATSIIGNGDLVYPHPNVTSSLDYEGELGIIVGKSGSRISKENAWDHVWGATIINDVTARERQRDHKQFYIGKSLDTFCPMGPFAVHLPKEAFNDMTVETKVNGERRQKAKVSDLIFDIPTLIEACSMGITLQEGDVIATGTPAGVALSNGNFLRSGDVVEVSITGLGTLSNKIAPADSTYPECESVSGLSTDVLTPSTLIPTPAGPLFAEISGNEATHAPVVTFVHGLGGNSTNFAPLIAASGIDKTHRVVLIDLPGHGLTPSGSAFSVERLAKSVNAVLEHFSVNKTILVGHSMGGIISTTTASLFGDRISRLGPVMAFNDTIKNALNGRAATVLDEGMSAIANTVATGGTSAKTNSSRPLAKAFVLSSLLAANPEGYAHACQALAQAQDPAYGKISVPTLIIAASEDKTAPDATTEKLVNAIKGAKRVVIQDAGHWMLVEDVAAASEAFVNFLGMSNGSH